MTGQIFALLVGINSYPVEGIESLEGCVNDVKLMGRLIKRYYEVPNDNIRVLFEEDATRKAIEIGFREHLIARAKDWMQNDRQDPAPAFLFFYAGHGSQAPDATGSEPDALDETIVPYDGRADGIYDIKDWEIGQWLDQLTEYTDNVTVILDCCHSGSGTRDIKRLTNKVRLCRIDTRPQPQNRPRQTRSLRLERQDQAYILLAASRDRELAKEIQVTGGELPKSFGVFTYYLYRDLTDLLKQDTWQRKPTYNDLIERVRLRVKSANNDQTPQGEGNLNREIFSGIRVKSGLPYSVVEVNGSDIIVDGGLVHGLTVDSLLHAYQPHVIMPQEDIEPIATLRITKVDTVTCSCQVDGDRDEEVPLHAKVNLYRPSYGDMQCTIALEIENEVVRGAIAQQLEADHVKPYVRVVAAGSPATFRLTQVNGDDFLELLDRGGSLLAQRYRCDEESLGQLGLDLAHMVRYKNALALRNLEVNNSLAGKVSLALKRLLIDNEGGLEAADFLTVHNNEIIIVNDTPIVIELRNQLRHNDFIYMAVLNFSYDWSVSLIHPRTPGSEEALKPRLPFSLGMSSSLRNQLRPGLPEDINEVRSVVKVIATRESADFEILQQSPLKQTFQTRDVRAVGQQSQPSALSKLLELAVQSGTRRQVSSGEITDEWTTLEAEYFVVQTIDHHSVSSRFVGKSGEPEGLMAYDLKFELPEEFSCQLRVLSERQLALYRPMVYSWTKSVSGLSRLGEDFQLLTIAPSNAAGVPGVIIEIEAETNSLSAVSADTPIRLHLPQEMMSEGGVVVLTQNDNEFYLIGRLSENNSIVQIDGLPVSAADQEGVIRLALYQIPKYPEWLVDGWDPQRSLPWTDS